jgi:Mce-associated membrane protein
MGVVASRTYHALMPPTSSRRRPLLVAALVLAVGVAASVLSALSIRAVSRSEGASAVSVEALAAGRQIAVDFAAYDYRHIAEDFKRVADESVGDFHKQYLTGSTGVHEDIVKLKAVSTAEVASAAVVNATPTRATVVVAVNRTVDNTRLEQPQKEYFGVEISLVHQRGRWLASDLKPL